MYGFEDMPVGKPVVAKLLYLTPTLVIPVKLGIGATGVIPLSLKDSLPILDTQKGFAITIGEPLVEVEGPGVTPAATREATCDADIVANTPMVFDNVAVLP